MRDRYLGKDERALWGKVTATVRPLSGRVLPIKLPVAAPEETRKANPPAHVPSVPTARPMPARARATTVHAELDGHWDRRLKRGNIQPDFSVDLHGMTVAQAHGRLDRSLEQARITGARVLLLITGRPRPHDRVSGTGRGAIRAAVEDWLAVSRHSSAIAAVRRAHPRHGGDGALYIILRRN